MNKPDPQAIHFLSERGCIVSNPVPNYSEDPEVGDGVYAQIMQKARRSAMFPYVDSYAEKSEFRIQII